MFPAEGLLSVSEILYSKTTPWVVFDKKNAKQIYTLLQPFFLKNVEYFLVYVL